MCEGERECVCVGERECVCVRERERECVCTCVCEREVGNSETGSNLVCVLFFSPIDLYRIKLLICTRCSH